MYKHTHIPCPSVGISCIVTTNLLSSVFLDLFINIYQLLGVVISSLTHRPLFSSSNNYLIFFFFTSTVPGTTTKTLLFWEMIQPSPAVSNGSSLPSHFFFLKFVRLSLLCILHAVLRLVTTQNLFLVLLSINYI